MASRRERIDNLLTRLVGQLEKRGEGEGGFSEADARVLIVLHKTAVGYDDTQGADATLTEDERRVIHDLARLPETDDT